MIQVNILVEGQTEEIFVKELLSPYLSKHNININPIIISTKRLREGTKFKGGLSNNNFEMFIEDIRRLIYSTPHGYVSTFIDYYRLPSKFPGYQERLLKKNQLDKVIFLEQNLLKFLGNPRNFIPYIQLHEFETFHFVDEKGFSNYLSPHESDLNCLLQIIKDYPNPEDINEGPETAPSKRIKTHYPYYEKVNEGNLILLDIGMERIIEKCPHFNNFIKTLINLKERT